MCLASLPDQFDAVQYRSFYEATNFARDESARFNSMGVDDEAQVAALQQVSAQFTRPDQLEKLPELKKRADRKKAAVEAMLRTGVQSQLEGIRTAIAHLHTASEDIIAIETGLDAIRTRLIPFPQLKVRMAELRDANILHGQYAAAMENLKHIFNINKTLDETREAISNGHLLIAHKNIMDLELSRDELLFEVHKLPSGNTELDKNLLIKFFNEVDVLVQQLGQNMWFIIGRSLEMVKGNQVGGGPQELVSCLRIVEREERIDKYYLERQNVSNPFMPPGRPRAWRKKTMEVIEKTVIGRVEGNQLEDRSISRQWLARYLEVCRRVVLEDLQVARTASTSCFPPEYQIYDRFVNMYHRALSNRLRQIANDDLQKNELVQLLSWVQAYPGEEMLGNRRLQINATAMLQDMPLLSRNTMEHLYDEFVDMTRRDMREWLRKTVDQEKDDWYKHVRPEEDGDGYMYTQMPSILFGMIEDTVALCKEISTELIPRVINVSIEEFIGFADHYRDAAMAYRGKYFEDRSRFKEFTSTMIAIANNLHTCVENTDKYMKHIRLSMEGENEPGSARSSRTSRREVIDNIDKLNAKWNDVMLRVVNALLEEVVADIAPYLAEIFTKKWLVNSTVVETVCITLHDYHSDHSHLRPYIQNTLVSEIQFKVIGEYIRAVEAKRLSFSNVDERTLAGSRLHSDAEKYEKLFSGLLVDAESQFTPIHEILPKIGDVISLRDKSILSLEATTFGRKYPDVGAEFLAAVLAAREDVGRTEAKSLAEEVMSHVQFHPREEAIQRLFDCAREGAQGWSIPSFDMGNVLQQFITKGASTQESHA